MANPKDLKDFVASCGNCRKEKECKYRKHEIKHPDAQDNRREYMIKEYGSCDLYKSTFAPENPEPVSPRSPRRRAAA